MVLGTGPCVSYSRRPHLGLGFIAGLLFLSTSPFKICMGSLLGKEAWIEKRFLQSEGVPLRNLHHFWLTNENTVLTV